VLVLPAWFDEGNKLRHFTVEVMRRLDGSGIDTILPDLPGCNESLVPLDAQTLDTWRSAAVAASRRFSATHVLSVRAGAMLSPDALPRCPGADHAYSDETSRDWLLAQVLAALADE
jgi:hypothetical protein